MSSSEEEIDDILDFFLSLTRIKKNMKNEEEDGYKIFLGTE